MRKLYEENGLLIIENDLAAICINEKDGATERLTDKTNKKDILREMGIPFFVSEKKDGEIALAGLELRGDVVTVSTEAGDYSVTVGVKDRYFTFEISSPVPKEIYRVRLANTRFESAAGDKRSAAGVGVAMTTAVDPVDFPDGKSGRTGGLVYPHINDVGAKYALCFGPIANQREILKEICLEIDKNKGICSTLGGAWGRDKRINFTDYTIQFESEKSFIENSIPFFKEIGVDQIDFHQGAGTFRQGDFEFHRYKDAADFRKNVTELLERNGMTAGLHTYSHYIDYECASLLSKPENQKQLKVFASFTLAADISEESTVIPIAGPIGNASFDFGFNSNATSFLLIDNEIIRFRKGENGLEAEERGHAGTKKAAHKNGAAVKQLEGHYFGITPVPGSELFKEIARRTAETYNAGGFRSIYLDALDGIAFHTEPDGCFYHTACFIREVLKYCEVEPLLEASTYFPAIWAYRGRVGALDCPRRAYDRWNDLHSKSNLDFIDRYGAPMLGWYDFYPTDDGYPGNFHVKYHHAESIDHMGTLAVAYDFSNVFNGTGRESFEKCEGLRRNVALYVKYDRLRKSEYFSIKTRGKLAAGGGNYRLTERDGVFLFEETAYRKKKLYDLSDAARNKAAFENPFEKQTPFVRIEALLSSSDERGITLLPLDESKPLSCQTLYKRFEEELDLSERLALKVRVFGNGEEGKIGIKLKSASDMDYGYALYIIDTDFEGEREFILAETDNGERDDHGFEKDETANAVFRAEINFDRITEISVMTEGGAAGARMSSVTACRHSFKALEDPTVTVGNTSAVFGCELRSTDFIEFDGAKAEVVDRYGSRRETPFRSDLTAPGGRFEAAVTASLSDGGATRAILTLGFKGKEIE